MRIALRRLVAAPVYATFSIVTLALGIGVVTAVYSVMYVTFARPLGIEDAGRIVILTRAAAMNRTAPARVSWPDYEDLQTQQRSFEDLFAWAIAGGVLAGPRTSDLLRGEAVTGGYFGALGVRAARGRLIQPADDQPGAQPVLVLADLTWRHRFDADPAVIGSTVRFDERPYVVIGVAPVGFRGIQAKGVGEVGVWVPLASRSGRAFDPNRRDWPTVLVAGRLPAGASRQSATMDAATIAARLDEAVPLPIPQPTEGIPNPVQPRRTWEMTPLSDSTGVFSNEGMRIVIALPFLVLLVACTNLANLILSRGASRRHEYAVRGALGASRWRLLRDNLSETAILAVAGGALGVLTTQALLVWAVSSVRESVQALTSGFFPVEWRMEPVVFAAVGVCVLIALAVGGLVPALTLTRLDPGRTLTIGDAAATQPRWRGRSNLISLQVAVSAALFLITFVFVRFLVVDPPIRNLIRYDGLEATALASLEIDPRPGRTDAIVEQALRELGRHPDVASVAASSAAPFQILSSSGGAFGAGHTIAVTLPGQPFPRRVTGPRTEAIYATRALARTVGLTMRRGRFLRPEDVTSGSRPVVIDEAIAVSVFGSSDVVGRTLLLRRDGIGQESPGEVHEVTVVGVAASLGRVADDSDRRTLLLYAPFQSRPAPDPSRLAYWRTVLMARSRDGDGAAMVAALRAAVRRVDPDIAVVQAGRGDLLAAGPLAFLEFAGVVFGGLAVLALALSMAGLYGVLSHVVDRRTREMGIRIALGAERGRIARLVLRQGFRPIAEGLSIGLGAAWVIRYLIQSGMTAELSPLDIATFALAAVPLLAAGLIACYLPARRAAAVNPLDALRQL
jgi:predicted permease